MTKHAKIGGTSKCMQWKNNHNNKTEKKRKQQQRVVPRCFTWHDNSNELIEYVYAFFARPWDSRKWTTNSNIFSSYVYVCVHVSIFIQTIFAIIKFTSDFIAID